MVNNMQNNSKDRILYIFFTASILYVGGMQQYVRGKVRYLKEKEYDVVVLFPGECIGRSEYDDLDEYICGGNSYLNYLPDQFSNEERNYIVERVIKNVSIDVAKYRKVYIESHYDIAGTWGEVFAERLHAKHYFLAINELYRGNNKYYEEYMDFFLFKLARDEIVGLVDKLFEGYQEIDIKQKKYDSWVAEMNPIEEKQDERIKNLIREEYNIALISRGEKEYVPSVIESVAEFAKTHNNSKIQIVLIGDYSSRYEEICKKLLCIANIKVYLTGNMVPIPRQLFKKVDVILANSGTARACVYENVPTIVLSHEGGMCNGVMGYDCSYDESIYLKDGRIKKRIVDVLNDVLINGKYSEEKPNLPKQVVDDNSIFEETIKLFENNYPVSQNDYYHFEYKKEDLPIKESMVKLIEKYGYIDICPQELSNKKIILFGAGGEGNKCIEWLKSIKAEAKFIIDNDEEKIGKRIGDVDIYSPSILRQINMEEYYIIIANLNNYTEIMLQLVNEFKVRKELCLPFRYLQHWMLVSVYAMSLDIEKL